MRLPVPKALLFICICFVANLTHAISYNRFDDILKFEGDTVSPNFNISSPGIDKGKIPIIKFELDDPCSPKNSNVEGLPWDVSSKPMFELSEGFETEIPSALPDYQQLSMFSYNSAVSVAFEGMKLIYGVMPQEEYQKFESIWQPLFDFPSQEIIDYLNALNPLIA